MALRFHPLRALRRWLSASRRADELERAFTLLSLSEERFRCLAEATSAVIWRTDAKGVALEGTHSWVAFTGQGVGDYEGWGWLEWVHPNDREQTRRRWTVAVETQTPYETEYRLRQPDGSWARVVSRGVPVRNPDGSVREWIGSVQDISALRSSEEQAAERLRELERTQQRLLAHERLAAVGELSAIIAHEVRNPLGAIFNALSVLTREVDHPLLDVIREESDRLNLMVNELLDFARPLQPRICGQSMAKVIEQSLQAVELESRRVKLVLELSPEMDSVPMDGRLMRQLIINLVENAAQAMPTGGHIRLRTLRAGSQACLSISDSGPGIPPHLREKVFEPFFTTKATGTGLGLAVVKRIAESHGGSVTLTEAAGGGCEFQVRLPISFEPSPSEPAKPGP